MSNSISDQLVGVIEERFSPFTRFTLETMGMNAKDALIVGSPRPVHLLTSSTEVPLSLQFKHLPALSILTNTYVFGKTAAVGPFVSAITCNSEVELDSRSIAAVRRVFEIPVNIWLNVLGVSYQAPRLVDADMVEPDPKFLDNSKQELVSGLNDYLNWLEGRKHPAAKLYATYLARSLSEITSHDPSPPGQSSWLGFTPFYDLLEVRKNWEVEMKKGGTRGYLIDNPYPG